MSGFPCAWCRRRDLNPHGREAHCALNAARLPVPPLRPAGKNYRSRPPVRCQEPLAQLVAPGRIHGHAASTAGQGKFCGRPETRAGSVERKKRRFFPLPVGTDKMKPCGAWNRGVPWRCRASTSFRFTEKFELATKFPLFLRKPCIEETSQIVVKMTPDAAGSRKLCFFAFLTHDCHRKPT